MSGPNPLEELLRPAYVAAMLHKSVGALAQWRSDGRGPAYLKLGGRVYYRLADLERFLAEHTVAPVRP